MDFFDLKLLTPLLKQLFNVDFAGLHPASLCSQSPLQWREYFSAQPKLGQKKHKVRVIKKFFQHFSHDKIVNNT
jgi:hypothetical protein